MGVPVSQPVSVPGSGSLDRGDSDPDCISYGLNVAIGLYLADRTASLGHGIRCKAADVVLALRVCLPVRSLECSHVAEPEERQTVSMHTDQSGYLLPYIRVPPLVQTPPPTRASILCIQSVIPL